MSLQPLNVLRAGQISYSARAVGGRSRAILRVGANVARDLGWIMGERVNLTWGVRHELGIVRVHRDAGGLYLLRVEHNRPGGALVIEARITARLPGYQRHHKAVAVQWSRLSGSDGIEVCLPATAIYEAMIEPPIDPRLLSRPIASINQPQAGEPLMTFSAAMLLALVRNTYGGSLTGMDNHELAPILSLPTGMSVARLLGELQRLGLVQVDRDEGGHREIRAT